MKPRQEDTGGGKDLHWRPLALPFRCSLASLIPEFQLGLRAPSPITQLRPEFRNEFPSRL